MSEIHSFGVDPITCHAFNQNRQCVALAKNSPDVTIYQKVGGKWSESGELKQHSTRVTGVDWAPSSNRIVTCGADRNAFVWTEEGGKWNPELVILNLRLAATAVRWSPKGDKFAVGSGSKVVAICYYDMELNWWSSKHLRKGIKSTITCLDWHPNNVLMAAGSTDFKARIFSAYVKGLDSKPEPTGWGSKMPFGAVMGQFSTERGGWVHSVCFSASGNKLAWVGHDSSVVVVDAGNGQTLSVLHGKFLPLYGITWVTENTLVAAGYDCCPMVFAHKGEEVVFVSNLDIPSKLDTGKLSAMKTFRQMDSMGHKSGSGTTVKTMHQNTINQVSVHTGTKKSGEKVATSGVDGQLIIWDLKSLEKSISELTIA